MSIVVAIGVVLLGLLIIGRRDAFLLKMSLLAIEFVLLVVVSLAVNRKDDLFLRIPGTVIENAAVMEVDNSGSMYLDSGQSVYMDNKFYITDDNYSGLGEWLDETQKNVYLYIVKGSNIIYKKNLGLCDEEMSTSVWSIYNSWKDSGVVPTDGIKYWFLFLYLEV